MGHSRQQNKAYVQAHYPEACIALEFRQGEYKGLRINHAGGLRPRAQGATHAWRLAAEQIQKEQRR